MILLQSPLKHLKVVVGIPKGGEMVFLIGGYILGNLMRKNYLSTFKLSCSDSLWSILN